ncbi:MULTISPECIES: hypothetical protein [Fischerella]|nr:MULTISPECIES: hypothetical protein [Fischerella]
MARLYNNQPLTTVQTCHGTSLQQPISDRFSSHYLSPNLTIISPEFK